MLYIRSLTTTERGLLRQRQRTVPVQIASRARMILLSADGWSVPAIATLLACCRRTVRKWLHAFTKHGLAGLVGKPVGRPAHRVQTASSSTLSATSFSSSDPSRLVPVIELTVPEIRRILNRVLWRQEPAPGRALHWLHYRRYKQALAKQSHNRKRGATPPPFQPLRLEY